MANELVLEGGVWKFRKKATSSVVNFAGVSFDTQDTNLVNDNNLKAFIAPSPQFPFIKDIKGTLTDSDFNKSGINTFSSDPEKQGRLPNKAGYDTDGISGKSDLIITGALTIRSLVAFRQDPPSYTGSVLTIGMGVTSGSQVETQAGNTVYLIQLTILNGIPSIRYFCETGSGSNKHAFWRIPGRFPTSVDIPILITITRTSSGNVACYAWQHKLGDVISLSGGMSHIGNGVASGGTPNGGSLAQLQFFSEEEPAIGFHAIYDSDESANQDTFCNGILSGGTMPVNLEKQLLPASSVLTTLASESNTVSLFVSNSAKSSGYEDLKGYIDGNSAASNAAAKVYIGSSEFTKGSARFTTSSKTDLQITGTMTLRALVMFNGTSNRSIVAHATSGESPGSNYLYTMWFGSTTTIRTFWESGSGSNHEVHFNIPAAYSPVLTSQPMLISLVRENDGGTCDVYCYVNGVQCTVSSVSGVTNNTTHASGNFPSGGGSGSLYLGSDPVASGGEQLVKMIHILDSATAHATREAEVASLFGF